MSAVVDVLKAAQAPLTFEPVRLGLEVYREGVSSGVDPGAWDLIRRSGVLLKGPISTPQGGGVKSVNVTLRKSFGLFANVRPCLALAPFVPTLHPGTNLVVVRENEEDLYAGIEHRQTDEVVQCLKLVSRPGCERIVRYAFEYARRKRRRRVTCMTKDNIMKLTDGLFHRVFDEIGKEYPDIEREHMIIDIGTARVAVNPAWFDVIVLPNLYGDILSDVAAEVTGSVGMACSANIGETVAMFEAVHGSAPDIAGHDLANPSGLLGASVMMLRHLGMGEHARTVQDAWLCALEDGVHTRDIVSQQHTLRKVGTAEFAAAVIERLGRTPRRLPSSTGASARLDGGIARPPPRLKAVKELVGVDVFFDWDQAQRRPDALAERLQAVSGGLRLELITNRGTKVWPEGLPETVCADHWRCRFKGAGPIRHADIVELLGRLSTAGLDFIKTEHLYTFDGAPGFSMGQGQ
jgi:isocitrate dehydrogenase